VLDAAKGVEPRPIAKRLRRFSKAHRARLRGQRAIDGAERKLTAQQRKLAVADVTQDGRVDALVAARIGAGANKTQPFADLGAPPPSTLKTIGYAKEARACLSLTGKIVKRKEKPRVAAAARRLAKAADAVLAAHGPIATLQNAVADARRSRDADEQEWETAFASLRDACKLADRDTGSRLFDALFVRTAGTRAAPRDRQVAAAAAPAPKKRKAKAAAPTNGAPAPSEPGTPTPTE
jgi:hypothetical protein